MARTKGAKDKQPRKKRGSSKIKASVRSINLASNRTSYEFARTRIASR